MTSGFHTLFLNGSSKIADAGTATDTFNARNMAQTPVSAVLLTCHLSVSCLLTCLEP